jgi:GT2 family glycosyltransferase
MKLGVPTLRRYDLLQGLLDSAESGSVRPDGYVIVDNGPDGAALSALRWPANTQVIRPGRNIGVSASWNRLLEAAGDEAIVISNDDVTLGRFAFERVSEAVSRHPLVVTELGWSLFAQAPACTASVGWYDEGFFPAYYEDTDYHRRCRFAGIEPHRLDTGCAHVGSATIRVAREINSDRSALYYRSKWGGAPGGEKFGEPFGGQPPAGWSTRTPTWSPRKLSGRDYIYQR